MRLEEWQKFIESQFLDDQSPPAGERVAANGKATPAEPSQTVLPLEPTARSLDVAETPEPIETEPIPPAPPADVPIEKPHFVRETAARAVTAPGKAPAERPAPTAPSTPHAGSDPFGLMSELDTEIPEFGRYLPASRTSGSPVLSGPTISSSPTPPSVSEDSSGVQAPPEAVTRTAPASEADAQSGPCSVLMPMTTGFVSGLSRRPVDSTPAPASPDPASTEISPDAADSRVTRKRARHARNVRPENVSAGLSAAELWAGVPRQLQALLALERMEEEETAQRSYKRPFQEKRHELIERLLDPILSLEDTARLLNVCPTTVRRYTNKGILTHYRKEPERSTRDAGVDKETRQRRFRLSDILAFLETQRAALEADRSAEQAGGSPPDDESDLADLQDCEL